MVETDKNDFYVRDFIKKTLEDIQDRLDGETFSVVTHYLNHDEYEMAFEILFLEIIKTGDASGVNLKKSKEIGRMLQLNEETVFDEDFWSKFEYFVSNNIAPDS